ncbi:MAG: hypothetical protein RJA98_2272 [Pseudomonadota bacterium]|jgi:hypothetical protein
MTDIGMVVGASLIAVPVIFDVDINRWIYYSMCLVGGVLCVIAGDNSTARMLGMGEPGEDLLREAWAWIKKKFQRDGD